MSDITTTITITLRTADALTGSELNGIMGSVQEHILHERDTGVTGFAKVSEVDVYSTSDLDLTPTAPAEREPAA